MHGTRHSDRHQTLGSEGLGGLGGWAAAAIGSFEVGPLLVLEGSLLGDEAFEAGEPLGVEATLGDGEADGATRLPIVLAVAEAALVHQLEDVG